MVKKSTFLMLDSVGILMVCCASLSELLMGNLTRTFSHFISTINLKAENGFNFCDQISASLFTSQNSITKIITSLGSIRASVILIE